MSNDSANGSGLNTEVWGESGVNLALRAIRRELKSQGRTFNSFIVNYDPNTDGGEETLKEFAREFNRWYPKVIAELEDGQELRLSLAVGAGHWTAVDITLAKGKAPFIFCLDAADDSRASEIYNILGSGIPDATVRGLQQLQPFELSNGEKILRRMQISNTGCARMTSLHLMMLSQMNVAGLLSRVTITPPSKDETDYLTDFLHLAPPPSNVGKVSPEKLPASFAPIFTLTQNYDHVVTLPKHLRKAPINAQGTSLLFYCKKYENGKMAYPFTGSVLGEKEAHIKRSASLVTESRDTLDIFNFIKLNQVEGQEHLKAHVKVQAQPEKKPFSQKFQQFFKKPPPPTLLSSLTY